MTREEIEEISEAISYIKCYRKLDENLHDIAPKGSVGFYATEKCLRYWDMAIEALEKDQPNKKTGHWIKTKEQDDAEPLILWKCSECLTLQRLKTNYCPNCGIKMVEKEGN